MNSHGPQNGQSRSSKWKMRLTKFKSGVTKIFNWGPQKCTIEVFKMDKRGTQIYNRMSPLCTFKVLKIDNWGPQRDQWGPQNLHKGVPKMDNRSSKINRRGPTQTNFEVFKIDNQEKCMLVIHHCMHLRGANLSIRKYGVINGYESK